jgi:DNA-binding CsgD family transcriptional regulator
VARYRAEIDRGREALGREAWDQACEEGARLTAQEAIAYARKGRGTRKRPSTGWESLTPAERDVVALVVEGLTNPEVGERLFISRRTVGHHLDHVYAKLGIKSRRELAQVARSAEASGRD